MNFLKRAILAVTRRKGKSVIMFVIFAAIANMVLAGLAIQHATEYASVLARQKLGGQLTLRYDMQSAMQKARTAGEQRPRIQSEPVTEEMGKMIAGQKSISGYNYIVNANGLAQGFTAVTAEETQQENTGSDNQPQGRGGFESGGNFVIPDVTVTGVSSSKLVDSFSNGEAKMINGRAITPTDADKKVALIEKNLAEQNTLKVGSKIKVQAARSEDAVEYSIVGIYETSGSSSSTGQGMRNLPFTEPYNRIFTDYKSAIPLKTVTTDTGIESGGIDQAVFFVDDPKNIETVQADAKSMKIDWGKFTLDANDQAYKQMMGPIENVASFSMTVVYIVAIAGAVILALVLMLSVKERMYETGVLLSMGEGKLKIIAQYVAEVLVIAVVAFSLSVFTGKFIAQGVGNTLLQREITVVQQEGNNNPAGPGGGFQGMRGGWFGGQSQNSYQAIDSLNVQITASEVEQMLAAGLLILIAGTILPAGTVMRFKPKTMLTKAA
ncbi:MAG: macrolide ABC transporter permease [Firmicutes bacterium HGW-Firmicutes-8]|nr:MAG: macrolide ABC transporter permease [Firmicutes bacterium HGW-Firmicutes-8]